MPQQFAQPSDVMRRAVELAASGIGSVEPNPPVGAVIVSEELRLIGEGFHQRFGGAHAEIEALRQAGPDAAGATMYVTLEPCRHHGQTPPCTEAVIRAGISKVVVGLEDPSPHAAGKGIARLREAGIEVTVGLLADTVSRLTAPFLKLVKTGVPFVHAKWAMTLDGKIASRTAHSQWISNDASRRVVHALRGRMDAVIVGAGTVRRDDPVLTARPAGPRTAVRVVVDSRASLSPDSQLVRTLAEAPVLVAAVQNAPPENVERLQQAGVDVLRLPAGAVAGKSADAGRVDLEALLRELGRRRMTNVLVEGGGELLGAFFDRRLIDEVHVFVAAKLVGGASAPTPLAGVGLPHVPPPGQMLDPEIEIHDGDVYIHGRLKSSYSA